MNIPPCGRLHGRRFLVCYVELLAVAILWQRRNATSVAAFTADLYGTVFSPIFLLSFLRFVYLFFRRFFRNFVFRFLVL